MIPNKKRGHNPKTTLQPLGSVFAVFAGVRCQLLDCYEAVIFLPVGHEPDSLTTSED